MPCVTVPASRVLTNLIHQLPRALVSVPTASRLRPGLGTVDRDRCPNRLRSLINQCWDAIPERRPAASEVVKVLKLVKQQVG